MPTISAFSYPNAPSHSSSQSEHLRLASYTDVESQVRVLQQLADSLADIGKTEEAINAYTSIIRFYGNLDFAVDPVVIRQVRQSRVGCYLKLGMVDEVEHEMTSMMSMSPSQLQASPSPSPSRLSSAFRRFGHFGSRNDGTYSQ